jgi:hypothetical protein
MAGPALRRLFMPSSNCLEKGSQLATSSMSIILYSDARVTSGQVGDGCFMRHGGTPGTAAYRSGGRNANVLAESGCM